jgi:ketosteroid isomerase-like protein
MYKTIAKRRARRTFERLSRGEWEATLGDVAEDVHHVFPGDNALGGERHSRDALRRWFERLYTVFPGLSFELKNVSVQGSPWDMWVAIEWVDRAQPSDGVPYANRGAHWIRLRRGKATCIHAYLDTEPVTATCRRLADQGLAEAAAPPITD